MNLSPSRIDQITAAIGGHRVIVLGDVMLDRYIVGAVSRISPEAPVPVVEVEEERVALGGASNVASNIAALGDIPQVIGVIGNDSFAPQMGATMAEVGVSADFLVVDPTRRTTLKTRVIADRQQVVRVDREDRREVSLLIENQICERFMELLSTASALILSDYGKGVITKSLLARVIPAARARGLFIAVDPKETHFMNYLDVSIVTPNHHEASFAAGRKINSDDDLREVGEFLVNALRLEALLVTRGKDGMTLFERNGATPGGPGGAPRRTDVPTFARRVFDVTGAGDTVIASLVSAVCAGATLLEATIVSNTAAGVVVGELGAANVSRARLTQELKSHTTGAGE